MGEEILKELECEITKAQRAVCEDTFSPIVIVNVEFSLSLEDLEDIKHVRNTFPKLYEKILTQFKGEDGL